MDKYKLAEWMHDNYEQLAKAENWQTQEITRVKFEDLPAENKSTMLALADRMLNTFLIIDDQANVSGMFAFAKWLTDKDCKYSIMYGGTPELEKDYRFASNESEHTIEEVIDEYEKAKANLR